MTTTRRPPKADLVAAIAARPDINAHDLAIKFSTCYRAMYIYLRNYGMTLDPPKEKVENILAGNPNISLAALARKLQSSRTKAIRLLKDYGLALPNRFHDQLLALYTEGITEPSEIAGTLGCSYNKAKRAIKALDLAGGGAIRAHLPACVACTDPIDPDDDVWGGVGELHFTCARWMIFQRVIAPDEVDLIASGDAVTWLTTKRVARRGVVKSFLGDIAHIRHGANAYQVPASRLTKIVP